MHSGYPIMMHLDTVTPPTPATATPTPQAGSTLAPLIDEVHEVIPITESYGLWHPQEGVVVGHFQPSESERIVTLLTRDIDYPNFKSRVTMRPDQTHRGYDDHRMGELHPSRQSDDAHGSAVSAPVPRPR